MFVPLIEKGHLWVRFTKPRKAFRNGMFFLKNPNLKKTLVWNPERIYLACKLHLLNAYINNPVIYKFVLSAYTFLFWKHQNN